MKKILLCLSVAVMVFGCAYQAPRHILQEAAVENSRAFEAPKDSVYQAVMKTLLQKNFLVKEENLQAGSLVAERAVEKGKRTYIVSLQARVFEDAQGGTTLFLNGSERCERTYVRDNTRFFLFIIPLPGGGGKEASTVVESVKPLRDEVFYNEIFGRINANLVP